LLLQQEACRTAVFRRYQLPNCVSAVSHCWANAPLGSNDHHGFTIFSSSTVERRLAGYELTTTVVNWGLIVFRDIPFGIAVRYGNAACAALLDPQAAEPLVWPSPLKFMSEGELEPEAKTVLEAALAQANGESDCQEEV
jgi:hypothetical protein